MLPQLQQLYKNSSKLLQICLLFDLFTAASWYIHDIFIVQFIFEDEGREMVRHCYILPAFRSTDVPREKSNSGIVNSNVNRRIRKENYMHPARAPIGIRESPDRGSHGPLSRESLRVICTQGAFQPMTRPMWRLPR